MPLHPFEFRLYLFCSSDRLVHSVCPELRIFNYTLDKEFCVKALEGDLKAAKPKIFNTDQSSQFTSDAFTGVLKKTGVKISMDGRGRALDNIFL